MSQVKKKLGRGLALFLAVLQVMLVFAVVPVSAVDDTTPSGTCGLDGNGAQLTWALDSEGTLTISGTGAMANYQTNSLAPWSGSSVKKVVIEEGATTIGQYAFYGCKALESVTLPASNLKSIAGFAFEGCSKLENVSIPASVKEIGENAFSDCTGLTDLTISEGVETIGKSAFGRCSGLTNVTIPDSVSSMAYFAFGGCTQLKEVKLPANIETIAGSAFEKCTGLESVTIPENVTSIEEYAFSQCTGLPSITIPKSVTSIDKFAFCYCSSLKKATYEGTEAEWKNIAGYDDAFANLNVEMVYGKAELIANGTCGDNLTWTLDSEGTLTISGTGAMESYESNKVPWDSSAIKTVVIEEGVTTIGHHAFYGCTDLTSVTIPNSVTYIGSCAFKDCSSLESVSIPENVTGIEDTAFSGCTSLESVTIPDSVTRLAYSAFAGCTQLKEVKLPAQLKTITDTTFSNCSNLTSVTIPASVTSIEESAFYQCSSLETVIYIGTTDQWNAIEIAEDNDFLTNATITCTDGDIVAKTYTLSGEIEDFGYFTYRNGGKVEKYKVTAKAGDNVWYCVYADDGYVLQDLSIDSTTIEPAVGQTSYADNYTMGTQDATITAKFCAASDNGFTIDYSSDLKNGTISVDKTLAEAGETVTVTVTPNPGYELASLTGNYEVKGYSQQVELSEVGTGTGVYTFTMPDRNVHLNAAFKIATDYDFAISEKNAEVTIDSEVQNIIDSDDVRGAEVTGIGGAVTDANQILDASKLTETTEMILYAKVTVTDANLKEQTISFAVKPVATVVDISSASVKTVEISNEMLNGNPITVKLPIPNGMDPKEIVHIAEDGTKEYYTLDGAKQFTIEDLDGQKVAVLQVTHFSDFTMTGTAHEHDIELKNAKEATCTEDGFTGDKVCKICTNTVEAGKALPAKGHTWDGGKVTQKPTLTKEGIKTYTCTVCNEAKTERIEKLKACDGGADCPTHDYKDLNASQWYHLDVDFVVETGLMVGTNTGVFQPEAKLTRAQMVQILYNWAGKPEVTGSSKFSDVADSAWYAKPVIWATENRIVKGKGNGKFDPNAPVTREEMVVMLYRYANEPEVSNALTGFADANKITGYAVNAVKWAVEQDILRGDGSPRKLRPTDSAKRCEVAAMLHRYIG